MTPDQIAFWVKFLRDPVFKGKDFLNVMSIIMATSEYCALSDSRKIDLLFLVVGMAKSSTYP